MSPLLKPHPCRKRRTWGRPLSAPPKALELWPHNPRTPWEWPDWGSPFPNPSAETFPASVSPLRVLKAASTLLLPKSRPGMLWSSPNILCFSHPLAPLLIPSPDSSKWGEGCRGPGEQFTKPYIWAQPSQSFPAMKPHCGCSVQHHSLG